MRATAARSTPFNATQRSEVSDQCFVNSDQQHSKIVPTKYTNHTGETSFVSCNSCLPRRSFVKVGDSLAQNIDLQFVKARFFIENVLGFVEDRLRFFG